MYHDTLSSRQLGAWIGAALCPVAVQLAANMGCRVVAVTGAVCALVAWLVWKWGRFGRWTSIGAYLFLIIYVGQLLRESAAVWRGNSYPWVPLMLLTLALWSSLKGAAAAARVGAVVFLGILIIYPAAFGAALREVNWSWAMEKEVVWGYQLFGLLLLPTLTKSLCKDDGVPATGWLLACGLALVGTVLTLGMRAGSINEMINNISIFGTLKHFEALICAGATLGWFSLLSLTLSCCGHLGAGKPSVVMAALVIAAWMLCDMHIQYNILFAFGAIFWVFVPLLTQVIDKQKNTKKSENTP